MKKFLLVLICFFILAFISSSNAGHYYSRSATGSFSPPDSGNLVFWLKADAIVGLNDNDDVTTWSDSQNSNDFTTASTKPTYQTNEQNSLPVVRYDGTNDNLRNSSVTELSGPVTLIMAFNPTNSAGINENVLDIQTGRTIFVHLTTTDGKTGWYDGSYQGELAAASGAQVMVWVLQTSGGEMFRDGSSIGTDTFAQAAIGGTLGLGCRYENDTSAAWEGDMFEVALYQSALSQADRQSWETYLNGKWVIY